VKYPKKSGVNNRSRSKLYSLHLLLRLPTVGRLLLLLLLQLGLPLQLVLGEEEDVVGLVGHALQVRPLALLFPPLEVRHGDVWDRSVLRLGFGKGSWKDKDRS